MEIHNQQYLCQKMRDLIRILRTMIEEKEKKRNKELQEKQKLEKEIKKNRTQKRPFSRTLSNVQEALLNELLLPGVIISDRVRVRLDGSQVRKVTLDKTEQHFLEERTNAIRNAYKKLTTRDIEINFEKEATFYVLKQG